MSAKKAETMDTYEMADGSLVSGEYRFVGDPDFFTDYDEFYEPVKVLHKVWRLVSSEELMLGPDPWHDDDDEEDEQPVRSGGVLS